MKKILSKNGHISCSTEKFSCVTNEKTGEQLWSVGANDVLVWSNDSDIKHGVPVCPSKYAQKTEKEMVVILNNIEGELF